jgi:hypothetical protein
MAQERHRRLRAVKPALALLGAFALALAAHGCATMDPSEEVRAEKEYRTGSNIPVRDRSGTGDAKSYDPASVQDALQRSMPRTPSGLKGG